MNILYFSSRNNTNVYLLESNFAFNEILHVEIMKALRLLPGNYHVSAQSRAVQSAATRRNPSQPVSSRHTAHCSAAFYYHKILYYLKVNHLHYGLCCKLITLLLLNNMIHNTTVKYEM